MGEGASLTLYLDYTTLLAVCQALFLCAPARLERVEWHTGGLSATDAHHLRFFAKSYIFPRRYLARTSWQFFLSDGAQSQPILAELARGFL